MCKDLTGRTSQPQPHPSMLKKGFRQKKKKKAVPDQMNLCSSKADKLLSTPLIREVLCRPFPTLHYKGFFQHYSSCPRLSLRSPRTTCRSFRRAAQQHSVEKQSSYSAACYLSLFVPNAAFVNCSFHVLSMFLLLLN